MQYWFLAAIVTLLGVIPLLVARKLRVAVVMAAIACPLLVVLFYFDTPSLVWPWWGLAGKLVLLLWAIAAGVACLLESKAHSVILFPLVLLVLMIVSPLRGWSAFNAQHYANLIGQVDERVWTKNIQPKNPKHIRMSSTENASALAKQALGYFGAIGSQFEIRTDGITPQIINGKARLVVPLDFKGWLTWQATKKVPGYIIIDAEDPHASAIPVQLPSEQQFVYTPGAFWGYNLERHLWANGYSNVALTSYTLEIDDNNKAWWTVTVYEPTAYCWGERMKGIVIVDPVTGNHTFYPVGKIPQWVDVALPSEFAYNYVAWRGLYSGGWLNTWWSGKALLKPEQPTFVYGSENEPYYVVDVTSKATTDTSLVGLYYIHPRTGKATFYQAHGSTSSAIVDAVNDNGWVKNQRLHGAIPQLYNLYGTMAAVVPLLNDSHFFQGVAIVNVENVQIMGVGSDQFEALRAYQKAFPDSNGPIAINLTSTVKTLSGRVDRIACVPQKGESVFYVYLEGNARVFTGSIELSPELPLTRPGDEVRVEFYGSDEAVEPLHAFDNLLLNVKTPQTNAGVK